MQRISHNTVELTEEEFVAHDYFNNLLDDGFEIGEAVWATHKKYPDLSDHFYDYLGS